MADVIFATRAEHRDAPLQQNFLRMQSDAGLHLKRIPAAAPAHLPGNGEILTSHPPAEHLFGNL